MKIIRWMLDCFSLIPRWRQYKILGMSLQNYTTLEPFEIVLPGQNSKNTSSKNDYSCGF
jgi:hypothetical protein